MSILPFEQLLSLSDSDVFLLKKRVLNKDLEAKCQYAFHLIFGQTIPDLANAIMQLESAAARGSDLAMLMLGYCCEMGLEKYSLGEDISLAISYYSQGYTLGCQLTSKEKTVASSDANIRKSLLSKIPGFKKQISDIISVKDFCVFSNNSFIFNWDLQTRKKLNALLPALASSLLEIKDYVSRLGLSGKSNEDGELLFQVQDLLIMPAEVILASAGRCVLSAFLEKNGYPAPIFSELLDRAMGRCLIDDDDKFDNDYIISGLRIVSGLSDDPIWQLRTGLWYEFEPESKDLEEAYRWYEKASKQNDFSANSLARIKAKEEFKIAVDPEYGKAEECTRIAQQYHSNMELANAWNIRAAIRGDISAIRKLEQPSNILSSDKENDSLFYEVFQSETGKVKHEITAWYDLIKKVRKECLDQLAKKAKEAEAARKREFEERMKKEKEAEAARRRAEEERLRKEKEAEAARKRAEEERKRKEKEAAEQERIKNLSPKQKFDEGKQLIEHKEYAKGVEIIKMASDEGLSDASKYLAFGFDYGENGITKVSGAALNYYLAFLKQASKIDKDIPRVNHELGRSYQYALNGASKDIKKAIVYYEKAGESGYVNSLGKMAFGYDFGQDGFPKDEAKALKYYLEIDSKPNKTYSDLKIVLYNLGQCFNYGTHGVDIDTEKAIEYYKRSAQLGYEKSKDRLKEIEKKKAEKEKTVKTRKRLDIFQIIVYSLACLIFIVKAIIIDHPFWVLFWGLIANSCFRYFLWIPQKIWYERKRNQIYTSFLLCAVPATTMCIYFINRAINNYSPFWKWFWIVAFITLFISILRGTLTAKTEAKEKLGFIKTISIILFPILVLLTVFWPFIMGYFEYSLGDEGALSEEEITYTDEELLEEDSGTLQTRSDEKNNNDEGTSELGNWTERYDYVTDVKETRWYKVKKNKKYGFVDAKGHEIVPPIYDYIYNPDSNTGFIKVEKGNKKGLLDDNGKLIIPVEYDYIYSPDSKTGLIKVEKGDKKGCYNGKGKVIIPVEYDDIYSQDSQTGWIKVEKGDKKGCYDSKGKVMIPVEFDYIYNPDSSTGLVKVEKSNKRGLYDSNGKKLLDVVYDNISISSDGTALVEKGEQVGRIDKNGKFIVPLQ